MPEHSGVAGGKSGSSPSSKFQCGEYGPIIGKHMVILSQQDPRILSLPYLETFLRDCV